MKLNWDLRQRKQNIRGQEARIDFHSKEKYSLLLLVVL